MYFSLIADPAQSVPRGRCAHLLDCSKQHGDHDHRLDDQIVLGRQAAGQDRGRQRLDHQRADDRRAQIDASPGERAAADHHGQDGVELDVETDADGIGGVGVGGEHHARPRRAERADEIGGVFDQRARCPPVPPPANCLPPLRETIRAPCAGAAPTTRGRSRRPGSSGSGSARHDRR